VLEGDVGDDDARALDAVGLHLRDSGNVRKRGVGGNAVVSDERGGEDEDLAEVGGVGHGLGVWYARKAVSLRGEIREADRSQAAKSADGSSPEEKSSETTHKR
jgi:hypothetical protein